MDKPTQVTYEAIVAEQKEAVEFLKQKGYTPRNRLDEMAFHLITIKNFQTLIALEEKSKK